MSDDKILVEGINCNNDEYLMELLHSKGYRGCLEWQSDTSLTISFIPRNTAGLIAEIETLGVTAKLLQFVTKIEGGQ